MFSAKNLTFEFSGRSLIIAAATVAVLGGSSSLIGIDAFAQPGKAPAKAAPAESKDKDKKEAPKAPPPDLSNAVTVSLEDLVAKPQDYLGKNIKFVGNFFAFSNLALDYKPAYRPSKTHLSFLVLRNNSHIPLSELKLAMEIPKDAKEKDPETELLGKLKDGDQIEAIGKVFSTALDDPWVDVYKIKKLSKDKDEDKKTASASSKDDKAKTETKAEDKPKADDKSKADDKTESKGKTPAKD